MKEAVEPGKLLERIASVGLINKGVRVAVPPSVKHNMVYDVALPPELTDFEFAVQNDKISITITKYIGNKTEVVIPSSIKTQDRDFEFTVTAIGESAFADCELVESIDIPTSVTSIGDYAFSGCESLLSLTIRGEVGDINFMSFNGCTSLRSLILPDSCKNLERKRKVWTESRIFEPVEEVPHLGIVFNVSKTAILFYPAQNDSLHYDIPQGVTHIGNYAFRGCKSLSAITIPDSVTSIGNDAFSGCESLLAITIPDSVTSIGNNAFSFCESLSAITIPDSVTSIGNNAFSFCESLSAITIPDSVTSIGNNAFLFCKSLSAITIPDSVTSIGNYAFCACESLSVITIPDSVTSIGNFAFKYCESLSAINIPESDIYIAKDAFTGTPLESRMSNRITENADISKDSGKDSVLPIDLIERNRPAKNAGTSKNSDGDSRLPKCKEFPHALICCTADDIPRIQNQI